MTRRPISAVALAAVAALAVAGCSSGSGSHSGSGSPGEGSGEREEPTTAQVAWAEKFCGQVEKGALQLEFPRIDPENPEEAKKKVVGFLGGLSAQLDSLEEKLAESGAPSVAGGEKTFEKAMGNLHRNQKLLGSATKEITDAKVSDSATLNTALTEAGKKWVKVGAYGGPAQDLRTNAELDKAFDKAASCKELGDARKAGAAPPR
jgi:hypothetical protein